MAIDARLNRMARMSVLTAFALTLAALLSPVAKYVIAKLHERAQQMISYPANDQLVTLPNGSTALIPRDSVIRQIVDWLDLNTSGGEVTFQLADEVMFEAGSASLTSQGWQNVAHLAHILRAYRNVQVSVLYSPRGSSVEAPKLHRLRAEVIENELRRFGVRVGPVVESPTMQHQSALKIVRTEVDVS